MTQEAYIFDAVRTPRGKGKRNGALYGTKAVDLLAVALRGLQSRNELDTSRIDDIVMGCVTAVGDQGADIAKTAAFVADWAENVSGVTLNRFCASGLEAVNQAAARIRSGWEQAIVAGGVESMSRTPMGSDGGAWALDPATNLKTAFVPQGISADLIATLEGFTREELDGFAVDSHRKAAAAWEAGRFDGSIVPVTDANGLLILDRDETVRAEASPVTLGDLKPSFQMMGSMGFDAVVRDKYPQVDYINHVHTPGNSSGIVDGAAAVLVGSKAFGEQHGLRPRARIVSAAVTSTDPTIMLTGPAPASRLALERAGLQVSDIDLFEVNEAFASVVLKFQRELNVPMNKINVNGGSIAMGHPLGATGAMLISTLLDELEARSLRYGLATLCVGGGMGIATIIERIESSDDSSTGETA